jgi:hypothetical protein
MKEKIRLEDFGVLKEFLLHLPDDVPELTIHHDEDGDVHFEWYFGEGGFVQLSIGDNFRDGVLYKSFNGKFEKADYTHAKLISWLLEQV